MINLGIIHDDMYNTELILDILAQVLWLLCDIKA